MRKIELLAPAKNFETGIAAVNCGADAVYIGPERFGARSAAGNTVAEIGKLINHAHKYYAKVYATINTILFEDELDDARRLIIQLYDSGIDGIIFQDMAILEMDLPPVPLHASTQCDNYDIEKIKFLDRIGIPRIVLARELTIDDVRMIRKEVNSELEYFIHGALCVSMSGRCYLSAAAGGRSANRGECAQPCRRHYTLTDSSGKNIPAGRYPLSIKDLNRTEFIGELIEAGIDSFKIEGRLKDINYVRNIVSHYRIKIDEYLDGRSELIKSSSGRSCPGFIPDPERTFSRGYTPYFVNGRDGRLLSPDTPKSIGKRIGTVTRIEGNRFATDSAEQLNSGDGLFFLKKDGTECGVRINRADDRYIYPLSIDDIYTGVEIFRNHDALFEKKLESAVSERRIEADIIFRERENGFEMIMTDSDGNSSTEHMICDKEKPLDEGTSPSQIAKQISKLGNTIFSAAKVSVDLKSDWFIPVSSLNDLRRKCAERLYTVRSGNYKRPHFVFKKSNIKYPCDNIDYRWNVSNSLARSFYERHGVAVIADSFETGVRAGDEALMTTKMCLKYESGLCPKHGGISSSYKEPFILDDGVRRFDVTFECSSCMMVIRLSREHKQV